MLKQITQDEINHKIIKHHQFLDANPSGERANFNHLDLDGMDLTNCDLSRSNINDNPTLWEAKIKNTKGIKNER